MRMENALTALVGEEFERDDTWIGTMEGADGSLYGIPLSARRVVKFNPVDTSITHIGPDFGPGWFKWMRGAMTENGVIYCPAIDSNRNGILKIDTNTDTVTELNVNLLPERGLDRWMSCALALDGCIYFMPFNADRMMKLDPNNNDAMSSVGNDLGHRVCKYRGTVVGIDGCVYGMPCFTYRIVKYDPINDTTFFVVIFANKEAYRCEGNGALGRDGCIYAFTAKYKRVLKIDTTNNSHCFVGNSIQSEHQGWGDAILGIDGCIYWLPTFAFRILKFDPHTNQTSLVGGVFESQNKWDVGCLASDGVIYCIPNRASRILSIDPWKEFTSSIKMNIQGHQEQLGYLFHLSDDIPNETNFDRAVTKFGHKRILKWLEECLPPPDRLCTGSNLYPFMILASCKESDVSVIYHFLRQVPSFVNPTHHHAGDTHTRTTSSGKKRKCSTV